MRRRSRRAVAPASRAGRARCDPAACERNESLVRHRRRRSRLAMRVDSRRPGPEHEMRLEMRCKLRGLHRTLVGIKQHPAQLRRREPFPSHRERRQMPVGGSGHARGGLVGALVARRAAQPNRASIVRPTRDVHDVTVPVIALPRKSRSRVTVHTAGVLEHGHHPLEKRRGPRGARAYGGDGCMLRPDIGRMCDLRIEQGQPADHCASPCAETACGASSWHAQFLSGSSDGRRSA